MSEELHSIAAELHAAGVRSRQAAGLAVRKAANDIQSEAKRFAPVDTGALRSSISVSMAGSNGVVSTAEIGPTVDYAAYVEFGTSRRAPAAFMGPAADRVLPEFAEAIEQLGGDIL